MLPIGKIEINDVDLTLGRAGGDASYDCSCAAFTGGEPCEHLWALALQLVRLPETLEQVIATGQPHLLCAHLYEIAVGFSAFYEQCPVLSAEPPLRERRLALARLTEEALTTGLGLLGIETLDRM